MVASRSPVADMSLVTREEIDLNVIRLICPHVGDHEARGVESKGQWWFDKAG